MRGLSTSSYEKLVDRGGKNYWPMWSADGRSLFFMSDQDRRGEHLDAAALRSAETDHAVPRRPRAVAGHLRRRQDDRLRARLFDLVARRGFGPAAAVPIRRRGASIGPVYGTPHADHRFHRVWRSRRTAGRWRSSRAAKSSRRRPVTAETPRASRAPSPTKRRSCGRQTAGASSTSPNETTSITSSCTTSGRTPRRSSRTTAKGDDAPKFSPDGDDAGVRARRQVRRRDGSRRRSRSGWSRPASSARRRETSRGRRTTSGSRISASARGRSETRTSCRRPAERAGRSAQFPMRTPTCCRGVRTARSSCSTRSQRTEDTSVVRVDLTLRAPKFGEDQFRDLFRDEPGRGGGAGGRGREAMRRRPAPRSRTRSPSTSFRRTSAGASAC